ncbi:MAG: FeoB-associated Cys-rich membrane protein [Clostridia bacterium]|nr:FeoB-associated Cys-rich membrane protein [Clostridia bacterium]
MLSWLTANLWTIVISLALLAAIAAIVIKLVGDKRKGRSSCSHGCANCAMHDQCHGGKSPAGRLNR